jgi:Mrp family chromosome partitioning ATPase
LFSANEKGGSGKSTVAMHIAVALLKVGQRVATIDLDSRQKSFTHYFENRKAWAKHARLDLELPSHYCIAPRSARLGQRVLGIQGFCRRRRCDRTHPRLHRHRYARA